MVIVASLMGTSTASGAGAELRLQPSVCALAEDQTLCRETIDIRWRTDDPLALCLFIDRQDQPLECWQGTQKGEFEYQAETDKTLTFHLRERRRDDLLASGIFEVIREQTEYRSRRRKPWNFF